MAKPTTEPCSSHKPAVVTAKQFLAHAALGDPQRRQLCRREPVLVRRSTHSKRSEMSLIAIGRIVRMESNVKDETRAGERADDLNLGKMRSGVGPCELRSIPARVSVDWLG